MGLCKGCMLRLRIVIVGAGFAGMWTAQALARTPLLKSALPRVDEGRAQQAPLPEGFPWPGRAWGPVARQAQLQDWIPRPNAALTFDKQIPVGDLIPGMFVSALTYKTTDLSREERALVEKHVTHSLTILRVTRDIPPEVLEVVVQHHERHDGSGYLRGLKANQICPFARIAGIADTFDAITASRPHCPPISTNEAMQ